MLPPKPETKEVTRDRVQIQATMRLCAMQKDGNGRTRDVGNHERHDDVTPPRQVNQASREKIGNIKQECSSEKDSTNNGGSLR